MSVRRADRLPLAGAMLAILFWGISFVATKRALQELHPIEIVVARFAIGAALLLGILAAEGRLRFPPREFWPKLALMGFIGVFVHQMLQAFALTMTSATHAGWLIEITPIWSVILAWLILGERIRFREAIAMFVAFSGAVLVITRGDFSSAILGLPSTRGDFLILASTVNWAVYTVIGRGTLRALGARRATAWAMTSGLVMFMPFFVARAGWRAFAGLTPAAWGSVLFLGICCSGLGYLLWYAALDRVETARVASLLHVEPLIAFAAAAILLGERVTHAVIVGGVMVLAGVMVLQVKRVEKLKS